MRAKRSGAQERNVRLLARELASQAGRAAKVCFSTVQLAGQHRRVLLVDKSPLVKRLARDLAAEGVEVVVPYTEDVSRSSRLAGVADSICVAARYIEGMEANACVVFEAARDKAVDAVLCSRTDLPEDAEFVSMCRGAGIAVYALFNIDAPATGWVRYEADGALGEPAWVECPGCRLPQSARALERSLHVCPHCGRYLRMSAMDRLDAVLDTGSFQPWDAPAVERDPLGFPGYGEKLESQAVRSGLDEAVVTGSGTVAGIPVAIGVMDPSFFMGSMGSVVGERLARLAERATAERLPLVVFTASGGARMQEGLVSLMQMAKVSSAIERHGEAGLLYVSVITDPTTGGVTASFATQGDIILGEPGALIGFAGRRVIQNTIKQELPEDFQTTEFALEHGLIDAVVGRDEMRACLANVLALHGGSGEGVSSARKGASQGIEPRLPVREADRTRDQRRADRKLAARIAREEAAAAKRAARREYALAKAEGKDALRAFRAQERLARRAERRAVRAASRGAAPEPGSAWASVQIARNVSRPTARFYIDSIVDGFVELHGDRAFGDDGAIVAGLGWIGDVPVTVVAEEKGLDLRDRVARNFGCPQPEGYRKAMRLMRQAEKFGRPVVTVVDTQGAFCGVSAEERGAGNAIAESLVAMAGLSVPIVSVLIGEGGSGGALALAVADRVAMLEHAVYSVLSPEGFASILWKDGSRAPEAAELMRMTAKEVHAMGLVDSVLPEGPEGAHETPGVACASVRAFLEESLSELSLVPAAELKARRYEKFRRM